MARRRARRVRAHAVRRPRRPDAQRVHVHDRPASALVLLLLPVVPGIGETINGARLWVADRTALVPAGGVRQGPHRDLPGVLPDRQARAARRRARGWGRSACRAPRTSGRCCSRGAPRSRCCSCERDIGASLLFFGVFVVMLWVASGRAAYLLARAAAVRRRRLASGIGAVRPRAAPRGLLAARARPRQGLRPGLRAARAGVVRRWRPAASSAPASVRVRRPDPVRRHRLHLRGVRRGARHDRRDGAILLPLPGPDRPGPARRDASAPTRSAKLLATGLTTIVAPADVRDRRRRDSADPAHRGDPAVRVATAGSSLVANFVMLALLVRVSSGPLRAEPERLGGSAHPHGSASALVALFGLLFAQVSYIQVFAADRIANHPANARRQIIAEYQVERGTHPGRRRHGDRARSEPHGSAGRSAVPAPLPRGAARTRISPATTRASSAAPSSSRRSNHLPVGRRAGARCLDAHRPDPRPAEEGGIDRHDDRRPTCRRRPRRRRSRSPAPSRRGDRSRAPATSSRSSPNPTYDPNVLSSQDTDDRSARRGSELNDDPEQPAASRARTTSCSRPDRRSSSSPRRRRSRTASGRRACGRTRTSSTCRSPTRRSRTSAASLCTGGSRRSRSPTPSSESCNVIFGEIGLELGADATRRAGARSTVSARPIRPADACEEPTIPFVHPVGDGRVPGAGVLRAARARASRSPRSASDNVAREPAPDGARRRGDRERRHHDAAPPRGRGRATPADGSFATFDPQEFYGQPICPRRTRPRCADDGRRRHERHRHAPRRSPASSVAGQDRHRPARRRTRTRTPGSSAFAPAGRDDPADRRRGYRARRRQPRQRGDGRSRRRADREGGHRAALGL